MKKDLGDSFVSEFFRERIAPFLLGDSGTVFSVKQLSQAVMIVCAGFEDFVSACLSCYFT